MKDQIKQSTRSGLISGVIIFFLILFGLTTTISEIFGGLLNFSSNTRSGNTGGLMLFFAITSLWVGSRSASTVKTDWKSSLVSGMFVGLMIGLIVGAFTFLVGSLDAANIEMRDYFAQFSRPNVQFLLYGRNVITGSLISFGIFLLFGALGGLLTYFLASRQAGEWLQKKLIVWKDKNIKSKPVCSSFIFKP